MIPAPALMVDASLVGRSVRRALGCNADAEGGGAGHQERYRNGQVVRLTQLDETDLHRAPRRGYYVVYENGEEEDLDLSEVRGILVPIA